MNLLILELEMTTQDRAYRGTYRASPSYCEELDADHEANQAFFWYCYEGDDPDIVHDLTKARELVAIYRRLDPPQRFEIVEVVVGNGSPTLDGQFLGFDVSADYYYSLLSWGLEIAKELSPDLVDEPARQILDPLLKLTQAFFQPQLNMNGLFDDYETARFCLECMLALQEIQPGLWENEEVAFEVVGLWKV